MQPVRVVLLTSIMAPHRDALFGALAADPRIELTVVYTAPGDPRRRWVADGRDLAFRNVVLNERLRIRRANTYTHVSTGLLAALRSARPEVVVSGGWDQPAYALALLARRRLGYRFLWWIENNPRDYRFDAASREGLKRRLIAKADGVIVPGRASRDYVESLGARPERLWTAPNAVGAPANRGATPDRSGRRGPVRFLCVARLEPIKGLLTLLDAWAAVRSDAELALAGFGSLERRVADRLASSDMPPVRLLGHLQPEALALEYEVADAFVLPSIRDPWGLAVNEAMAAALPVVVSSAAGAADDLVTDGWNGFVVPPFDAAPLTRALETLASDPGLRLEMGRHSSERIAAGFKPEHWAAGMAEAALSVAGRIR